MVKEIDPLRIYQRDYFGVGSLTLSSIDRELYGLLESSGRLSEVPERDSLPFDEIIKRRDMHKMREEEKVRILEMYDKNYRGVSVSKLPSTLLRKMKDLDLEDHIFLPMMARRDFSDPLKIYHEQHANVTRGRLRKIDPYLCGVLERRGLLDQIPLEYRESIEVRTNGDPWSYYLKHYNGIGRGELSKLDQPLYKMLRKTGLIEKIPRKN